MKVVDVKREKPTSEPLPEEEVLQKHPMNASNVKLNGSTAATTSNDDGRSTIFLESDSDDDDDWDIVEGRPEKKRRILAALPVGFLDPLKPEERMAMQLRDHDNYKNQNYCTLNGPMIKEEPLTMVVEERNNNAVITRKSCDFKQFWKAGDYEAAGGDYSLSTSSEAQTGIDHVRVHPKFLHSNATSHKWALGAFAELLDNALDEVPNGATYVHVDLLKNKKYQNAMLMVEDNGGGMSPDKIRQCMSLGYSAKSQQKNTIGQYGNGFKTSTMRLGADVIVFSRSQGKDKRNYTQSIGMLSYSFLTETGKADIVVPMIDYEKRGDSWNMMIRSSPDDWNRNLDLIVQWSPYESEQDLLHQFDTLKVQGTRIVIYNLWEDEEGLPELDFHSDEHDIQIRGVNRDEKKIKTAATFPNLRHYLTYRHSLRNYAAILYLKIPPCFRIILRGKDVEHYNIINDLIHSTTVTYRPQGDPEGAPTCSNMYAQLHIGFVKDADRHLDVQGFNVYHKNRLIKPFWRVWNAAGSNGRGVIGILEANFVQPAHDKQGFERTIVFLRLEARLIAIQKKFWFHNSHKVGYAQRVKLKKSVSAEKKARASSKAQVCGSTDSGLKYLRYNGKNDDGSPAEDEMKKVQDGTPATQPQCLMNCEDELMAVSSDDDSKMVIKLKEDNDVLKASLDEVLLELQCEVDRNQSLENDLREERKQRELTEQALREKNEVASDVIQELRDRVKMLEWRHFQRQKK